MERCAKRARQADDDGSLGCCSSGCRCDSTHARRRRVLVCTCGSVAAIRVPALVTSLHAAGCAVRVVVSQNAWRFLQADWPAVEHLLDAPLYDDNAEWSSWHRLSDPVLHIELRKWADVLLVCPLTAHTMAKIAVGQADNLMTCIVRAWDFTKPALMAPAMNTYMWLNPLTTEHLEKLSSMGFRCISPVAKKLACGDVGVGALAPVSTVASRVIASLSAPRQLALAECWATGKAPATSASGLAPTKTTSADLEPKFSSLVTSSATVSDVTSAHTTCEGSS